MAKLAIVIPAYKLIYFEDVLKSITAQTCKNFTVYIGNDCSPNDFTAIIKEYESKISLQYFYFDQNFGGKDLISHWERCIDLVKDEEWIWLFSDDDVMEPNCVEKFYKEIELHKNFDLFHFNVSKINSANAIIEVPKNFPEVFSVEDFVKNRLTRSIQSFVIEYIFRKSHFYRMGRFENFDLGWGSDDATWIKMGERNRIKTISEAKVFWRESEHNISPNFHEVNILLRKFEAQKEFSKWLLNKAKVNFLKIDQERLQKLLNYSYMVSIRQGIPYLNFNTVLQVYSKFYEAVFLKKISTSRIFRLFITSRIISLKRFIKKVLHIRQMIL